VRLVRYLFRATIGFLLSDVITQVLTLVALGLLVGGQVKSKGAAGFYISAAVAVFVALMSLSARRYMRDRHQPYRIRKKTFELSLLDSGSTIQFTHEIKLRARHSTVKEIEQKLFWTGRANFAEALKDTGSGYTMSTQPSGDGKQSVVVRFQFSPPLKRFRTATLHCSGILKGEVGFDDPSGQALSYQPYLRFASANEAQSFFSSMVFRVCWDDTLTPNWDKIEWREYRSMWDYQRNYNCLRLGSGEGLRLGRHVRKLGIKIQPNTNGTLLMLDYAFTRPR
jgi:hypothetical protein